MAFIRSIKLNLGKVPDQTVYPYTIPAIKLFKEIDLSDPVTFFIGENGTGKSTLIEAIAIKAGFNPEGGSKNFNFATQKTETNLFEVLQFTRNSQREKTGFFLRAESFFNVATNIDTLDTDGFLGVPIIESYGGKSLHQQSHGESFMSLINNRFGPEGLYILDEPEAALSQQRQLALLSRIHQLVTQGSQFIIATHSPILLAYPNASIYQLSDSGITRVEYESSPNYQLAHDFLNHYQTYINKLLQ